MNGMGSVGFHTAVTAMKSPMNTTSQPATVWKTPRSCNRNLPTVVAPAPNATKTNVKPATNSSVLPATLRIDTSPSVSSPTE